MASNLIFSEKILNGKITKKIIFNSIQKTVQANFGENAHKSFDYTKGIIYDRKPELVFDKYKAAREFGKITI